MIAIEGLSGTGKSTFAQHLDPVIGAAPGAVILRSDVTRKSMAGLPPTVRFGERAYATRMSDQVYGRLYPSSTQILRAGHSVIVDAVFGRAEAVAKRTAVEFQGLWLTAPRTLLET